MAEVRRRGVYFLPVAGGKASLLHEEGKHWRDVHITSIRRGIAHVHELDDPNKTLISIEVDELEAPLNPDINERFTQFRELAKLVLSKKLKSLLISGGGGIGKSYTIENLLATEELEKGEDYIRIKGHISPLATFNILKDNSDKIIIFDDCDSAFENPISANILKAVLDTQEVRSVQWLSRNDTKNSFEFTGSAIFLSNLPKEDIEDAFLSRSTIIDLSMTPEEKIDRMRYILPSVVPLSVDIEDKMRILNILDKYKYTIHNLNVRTLVKALTIYQQTDNLKLVKYQILNS